MKHTAESIKERFGSQLKAIRKHRNLTQEELAKLIDIDVAGVGRIERGVHFPAVKNIAKIMNVLKVDFNTLF